jgi:hypothetical protein
MRTARIESRRRPFPAARRPGRRGTARPRSAHSCGQLLREDAGVAALVAGGVGAADDLVEVAEGRLDGEQLVAADHLAVHAVLLHQGRGVAGVVEGFLVGVEVRDAALQPVVLDAGGGTTSFSAAWL